MGSNNVNNIYMHAFKNGCDRRFLGLVEDSDRNTPVSKKLDCREYV